MFPPCIMNIQFTWVCNNQTILLSWNLEVPITYLTCICPPLGVSSTKHIAIQCATIIVFILTQGLRYQVHIGWFQYPWVVNGSCKQKTHHHSFGTLHSELWCYFLYGESKGKTSVSALVDLHWCPYSYASPQRITSHQINHANLICNIYSTHRIQISFRKFCINSNQNFWCKTEAILAHGA